MIRLFTKRKKLSFYLLIFVVSCYVAINYISLIKPTADANNDLILNSNFNQLLFRPIIHNANDQNDNENSNDHIHKNKIRIRNSENLISEDLTLKKVETTKLTTTVIDNVTRFLVYDNGGFGTVINERIKCSSENIEIDVTGLSTDIPNADIFVFHMEVSPLVLKSVGNRSHYKMVFSMESEVNSLNYRF